MGSWVTSDGAYTGEYFAWQKGGAKSSAEVVVPILLENLQPKSVVDVGCGEGGWLEVFWKMGVTDVLGVDGPYVDRTHLAVPEDKFAVRDLAYEIGVGRKFDLVLNLEVAEHLPAERASGFIKELTNLGKVVVFSAAIPLQGGPGHVNEQWPDYWQELFKAEGYIVVDGIRKRIWRDERIEWWYRQNLLVFAREETIKGSATLEEWRKETNEEMLNVVHPKCFMDSIKAIPSELYREKRYS